MGKGREERRGVEGSSTSRWTGVDWSGLESGVWWCWWWCWAGLGWFPYHAQVICCVTLGVANQTVLWRRMELATAMLGQRVATADNQPAKQLQWIPEEDEEEES